MSNTDQVADFLKSGEQYLTDRINQQNGTSFTPGELNIGAPVKSADDVYNTDIEVFFPAIPVAGEAEPENPAGELHYGRFDLGRLLAHKNIRLRDQSYTSTRQLYAALEEEVRIKFDENDFKVQAIPAGDAYPKVVVIRADDVSLRFTGQFSIDILEAIEDDTSIVTAPAETRNVALAAPNVIRKDGTLAHGEGNPGGGFVKATNGEIEIAAAARLVRVNTVFAPNAQGYFLNVADNADWNIPFSFALVDERNADHITDLYDCSIKITAVQSGGVLNFALRRLYGKLLLVDADNDLKITDGTTGEEYQSFYQNIQRVSFYKGKLGSLAVNAEGAPFGDFRVELSATRRTGGPAVTAAFDVKVEGIAKS